MICKKNSCYCKYVSTICTLINVSIDILKITTNLKNTFYMDKEIQDIKKEFYLIKRSFIISTIDTDFVNFLENGNGYNVEFFNVH